MESTNNDQHWDTHVLWEGTARPWWRRTSRSSATTYRLTRDAIHIDVGDAQRHEIVPLWIVVGVKAGRSALQ